MGSENMRKTWGDINYCEIKSRFSDGLGGEGEKAAKVSDTQLSE